MKHVVWKAFYDYEKEEKYLNEMSAKGLALTDYSWCRYVFEDAPQGEYIYRIQLLENPINRPESKNYIKFMEETGAEFVASYLNWVYFRRKAADGEFTIYTDAESRIKHYKRIWALFALLAGINLYAGLPNIYSAYAESSAGLIPFNLILAIINLGIFLLFVLFLLLPLTKKIRALKKEKEIRE